MLLAVLATALVSDSLRWRAQRDRLEIRLLTAAPVDLAVSPLERIHRERTSLHAKVHAVRSLVNGASRLDPTGTLPLEERLRLLDDAESLAFEILSEHPANWEASLLLGTVVYVRRAITSDRRLITEASDWQEPIEFAIRLAPGKPEPKRVLAAYYLETWAYLSSERQQLARELLRSVFEREPETLQRLAPSWLQLAGSRDDALDILPDRPETWSFLRAHLAARREWPSVIRTHHRWLDALERRLSGDLDEAERRMASGDAATARRLCLSVLTNAPPHRRFAPLVERALYIQPPGIHGLGSTAPLREWLHFLVRLDNLALASGADTEPLLEPHAIRRLYDAVGSLEAPFAAHVALLGEDFYTLRQLTESLAPKTTSKWGAFLVAWARRQLEDEGPEKAIATLERTSALWKESLPFLLVRWQAARAQGDEEATERFGQALDEHRRARWSTFDWQLEEGHSWLRFLPATRARGLRIELVEADTGGDVIDILWNGRRLGSHVVRPGIELELALEPPLEPTIHLLELRSVRGRPIAPGRLELIP